MRAQGRAGRHISGAEGIYGEHEVADAMARYVGRARTHPKGRALKITLTVEPVSGRPRTVPALSVTTRDTTDPASARAAADDMLSALGVSGDAICAAWDVVKKGGLRGAAILDARSGDRLDHDPDRGVRASMLGASAGGNAYITSILKPLGLDTGIVSEALILASKVAHAPDVLAELCISDDPGYTTGYLASRGLGYVRLPYIKKTRGRAGGRVFFVKPGSDIDALIKYLEESPVLVGPGIYRKA